MTNSEVAITAEQARRLTDQIKAGVETIWHLIEEAYVSRAWSLLGYGSWDDYCAREFGTSRLRLPREDRAEVVSSMRELGMSVRAIATATGDSIGTVHEALNSGVQNRTPAEPKPITGIDGKTYTPSTPRPVTDFITADQLDALNAATEDAEAAAAESDGLDEFLPEPEPEPAKPAPKPTAPRQRPLPQQMQDVAWDIRNAADRLTALTNDARFPKNKQQASELIRGHLLYVSETVAAVLSQLDQKPLAENLSTGAV